MKWEHVLLCDFLLVFAPFSGDLELLFLGLSQFEGDSQRLDLILLKSHLISL